MRDMLRVTRPGGWCQMVELYYNVQSDNGYVLPVPEHYFLLCISCELFIP
jgi:hypothetical protein